MITFNEILSEMKNEFRELSGISPDDASDIGIRLKILAGQIFALYSKSEWLLRQVFPQTATGQYLDMHAAQRAISRKQPTFSSGELIFSRESLSETDITIPSGTICSTCGDDAKYFITTEDAVLSAGELSVTVPAMAENSGSEYNAAADTINIMVTPPQGIISVNNTESFTGGSDCESDSTLRRRLLSTYSQISNGANTAFYRDIALSHIEIGYAKIIPRSRGNGSVDVVLASPDSAALSQETIEEVTQMINNVKEVGTDVSVYEAEYIYTPINISVLPAEGYSANELISSTESALTSFINEIDIGGTLFLKNLNEMLKNIAGMENYIISSPPMDYTAGEGSKIKAVNMVITAMI